MSKRNKKAQNNTRGRVDYELMFYTAMAAGMGRLPNPRGEMNRQTYVAYLKRLVMKAGKDNMARLGQIWVDPELPDNWESVMGLMMLAPAKTADEYNAMIAKVDDVALAATPGGAGLTQEEATAAQGWWGNTQDWWAQTWSGDWDTGLDSFTEGWNALWSGNF